MDIIENIKFVIEKIRPFIIYDGGDIQFVKYDEKTGTVYVKLLGACNECIYSDNTIKDTVETLIIEEVPEVLKVEQIKED